jgi:predicted dehydrogenase
VTHRVGFVGTGSDPDDPGSGGFAMAYRHAAGYERLEDCELVACADLVAENAAAFADAHGIDGDRVYATGGAMLEGADLDVVSVAVPPAAHAPVVESLATHPERPAAIHCEKPMALTWGGARSMAQTCQRRGVQLTFNHQRRFARPWRNALELLEGGAIGDLVRVETWAPNLYDWGTHCVDLCGMFVGERPAEWVIGNVDYREESIAFGAHNENQAVAHWQYEGGLPCLAATGESFDAVGALHRLVGEGGEIAVRPDWGGDTDDRLRVRADGSDWRAVECEEVDAIALAVADVIRCLDAGEEPELSARNALNATEIIFGTWESARRRGRVEFPLEVEDNPLEAMVESGALTPEPSE